MGRHVDRVQRVAICRYVLDEPLVFPNYNRHASDCYPRSGSSHICKYVLCRVELIGENFTDCRGFRA